MGGGYKGKIKEEEVVLKVGKHQREKWGTVLLL